MQTRFWSKVDKSGFCWLWTASVDHDGYGRFVVDGKTCKAHRIAYTLSIGPIPDGLTIDHLCRNKRCVNPAHLEAVSQKENNHRGTSPSALNIQKTHCIRGHAF